MEKDIADYAKDGRLTESSDGKRYEWRKMIDAVKALGRRLFSAPQHHIGSKHPVPIMEPAVAAALFCGMLHSL